MDEQEIITAAADTGTQALEAKLMGIVTPTVAAEITGLARDAVDALRNDGRDAALALLDEARGLLAEVA